MFFFFRMGNLKRSLNKNYLLVLDRYTSDENILFVCAQCLLKEKLFKDKPFYAKKGNMAGKG